jgi:hypothetical protein
MGSSASTVGTSGTCATTPSGDGAATSVSASGAAGAGVAVSVSSSPDPTTVAMPVGSSTASSEAFALVARISAPSSASATEHSRIRVGRTSARRRVERRLGSAGGTRRPSAIGQRRRGGVVRDRLVTTARAAAGDPLGELARVRVLGAGCDAADREGNERQ